MWQRPGCSAQLLQCPAGSSQQRPRQLPADCPPCCLCPVSRRHLRADRPGGARHCWAGRDRFLPHFRHCLPHLRPVLRRIRHRGGWGLQGRMQLQHRHLRGGAAAGASAAQPSLPACPRRCAHAPPWLTPPPALNLILCSAPSPVAAACTWAGRLASSPAGCAPATCSSS